MDGGFDQSELARETDLYEAIRRMQRAAAAAWACNPIVPALSDSKSKPLISELSPEQTLDAMYEECIDVRLELLHCRSIGSDLRSCWANRLGDIDLRAASAPAEIERLRGALAVYETGCDDLDVVQIRHWLWRLRELCLRHHEFMRRAREQKPPRAPSATA